MADLFDGNAPTASADEKAQQLRMQEMDDRMGSRKEFKAQLALAAKTGRSCGKCSRSSAALSGLVRCKLLPANVRRSELLPCELLPDMFLLRRVDEPAEITAESPKEVEEKKPSRVRADWE